MPDQMQRGRFLTSLKTLGGAAGNARLRDALGWDEATYDGVNQALIDDGAIAADLRDLGFAGRADD